MKKLGVYNFILIISIGFNFDGIKENEEIWLQQSKIENAVAFEKKLSKKSEFLKKNVSLSKSVYPLIDKYKIAKPIIVKREKVGFLPLYAEYFYSDPDSIIRYISYDWEKEKYGNFFQKEEMWKEESKKLEEYNSEYERIKLILISKLGEPTVQDESPTKTKSTSGRKDYLSRNTIWENEEYHAKLNMIFESMTYRIRLNYYWKK
jgi:hypothetical protein